MKKLAYSVNELAEASSISAAKIRKDIRNGIIETKLCGTRRVIPMAEVSRYLGLEEHHEYPLLSLESLLSRFEGTKSP